MFQGTCELPTDRLASRTSSSESTKIFMLSISRTCTCGGYNLTEPCLQCLVVCNAVGVQCSYLQTHLLHVQHQDTLNNDNVRWRNSAGHIGPLVLGKVVRRNLHGLELLWGDVSTMLRVGTATTMTRFALH